MFSAAEAVCVAAHRPICFPYVLVGIWLDLSLCVCVFHHANKTVNASLQCRRGSEGIGGMEAVFLSDKLVSELPTHTLAMLALAS